MALHVRERTGRGQVIDAAIYESVLAMMENLVTEYDLTGYVRERSGSVLPGIAPSNVYPCADGDDPDRRQRRHGLRPALRGDGPAGR